jgi:flagellar hook-length control protein FliK
LNQATSAGSPDSRSGAPTQSTVSQAGAVDKIAAAIDTPVNASAAVVNSASLMQSAGKAEMRVAMQTDTLGALQLHAVLDNGQLGASIQVVSHDAHTLLSNDLPALQQVLTDQNLRVDHLAVINSPMTSGAGTGNGRGFHSEDFRQAENPNARWASTPPPTPVVTTSSGEMLENLTGRLSVRA